MCFSFFALSLILGMLVLIIALFAILVWAMMRDHHGQRPNEPTRVEQVERISREIEKINAMQAAGRISAGEAAELKLALEGERREWSVGGAEFVRKRLTKSHNRILAGVCGGLAEWLGCDATLLRIIYVVLTLFAAAFPGVILYLIMWIFMPLPDQLPPTANK